MKFILFLLIVIQLLNGLLCKYDKELLRRDSIVYGLATVNYTNVNDASVSTCSLQLQQFVDGVKNQSLWAYRLMDSSGIPEDGFLWGNNFWLGRETFCYFSQRRKPLPISDKYPTYHNVTETDYFPYSVDFFGAYVTHNSTLQQKVHIYTEDTIDIGLCLPSVCEHKEIAERLQLYLNEKILSVQSLYDLDLEVTRIKSVRDDFRWMTTKKFFIMVILVSLLTILTVVGTTYDVIINQPIQKAKKRLEENIQNEKLHTISGKVSYGPPELIHARSKISILQNENKTPSLWAQFILCFSFYSNSKAVLRTKLGDSGLPCVHGLRFGSMFWVIAAHSMFYAGEFTSSRILAFTVSEVFFTQPLANAQLSVDSFLFISGFLVSYLFYKEKFTKIGNKAISLGKTFLEFIMVALNRYLRLTPIVIFAIVIYSVIYEYYANTAIVEMGEAVHEKCSKYWWRNLLYIGNLFDWDELCLSWSWYLSADMQFFLISLILCFFSLFLLKTSILIMILLIIASCLYTTYITYEAKFIPTYDETVNNLGPLYSRPWIRIGPYLVGVITGYFIVKIKGHLEIKKPLLVFFWIVGPLLNLYILFALVNRKIDVVYSAFYSGFHRTLWGVGLAWLTVACITNHAGIINKVLSWRGFIPLSRLSLCAYLLNPFIVTFYNLNNEKGAYLTYIPVVVLGTADVLSSFFLAFFATVLIEYPTSRLIKLAFAKQIAKR
ncbi:nose resistant to fluoxetine protein 6-like [Chrysoperla carnea]|uniref:nose resistant to fluoxetine protein 6-like n=1 Tax=Chrysoperla carnea TaxID=189513 RepID=UPI001D083E22|nr:nose resistant to fluoxetine protein 6-like [Chrysoperla carnea]